jgi:hypothetical protein
MSSHHFVKEGQEPALLILDPLHFSLVEPLLEWVPLVIVHETALEQAISWGIKIDLVLARAALDESLKYKLQSQGQLKILNGDPATDPLESALHFLVRVRQRAVCIAAHSPDKLFKRLAVFRDLLTVSILTPVEKWSLISSGTYNKWVSQGSKLRFHGLHYPCQTEGLPISADEHEVLQDGFITIYNNGPFWVGEIL